jgi:hypothetical protein
MLGSGIGDPWNTNPESERLAAAAGSAADMARARAEPMMRAERTGISWKRADSRFTWGDERSLTDFVPIMMVSDEIHQNPHP